MRRYIVGLLLALFLLSGCARGAKVLVQTETCRIMRDGARITVCCTESGNEYNFTARRVVRENGEKRDVKTLVDNDELRVVSFGGVLCVEDCAAGEVYVVHP